MKRPLIIQTALTLALAMTSTFASDAENEYWQQKASLYEILPVGPDDIIFLGNSITDGGEFAELFENPRIKNRGISGDVIKGIDKRIGHILDGKPAKIFLLVGINDISHNIGVERLSEEYTRLIRRIRSESPSTRLFIQSVMPVNNTFNRYKKLIGKENTIKEFNKALKKVAAENGAEYIDLTPALSDKYGHLKKEFTNDGLHLTGDGYKAWTDLLRQYVNDNNRQIP